MVRFKILIFGNLAALFLAVCIAAFVCVACAADCDPDSDGKPASCSVGAGNYRNFWDPTRYWLCATASGAPVDTACDSQYLFDPTSRQCVFYNDWNKLAFVPYCP